MDYVNQLEVFERHVVPLLDADGFTGSNGTWRRTIESVINCVEIQVKSDKSACCVNLGVHFTFLPVVGGSQGVDIDNLLQSDCELKTRLAWEGESGHWWPFDDAERNAIDMAACFTQIGKAFFARFSQFPHPFLDIDLKDIASDANSNLFPMMTKVRKVLLLARIHDYLGHADAVVPLCNLGIEVAGMASGPKAAFRDLLRKYKS